MRLSKTVRDQEVASPEGLEPPTSDLEGRCSIQLSYGLCGPGEAERRMVEAAGFELGTCWSQSSATTWHPRALRPNPTDHNRRILPRQVAGPRARGIAGAREPIQRPVLDALCDAASPRGDQRSGVPPEFQLLIVLLIKLPPSVSGPVCSCCPAPNSRATTCASATWLMCEKNQSTLSS